MTAEAQPKNLAAWEAELPPWANPCQTRAPMREKLGFILWPSSSSLLSFPAFSPHRRLAVLPGAPEQLWNQLENALSVDLGRQRTLLGQFLLTGGWIRLPHHWPLEFTLQKEARQLLNAYIVGQQPGQKWCWESGKPALSSRAVFFIWSTYWWFVLYVMQCSLESCRQPY